MFRRAVKSHVRAREIDRRDDSDKMFTYNSKTTKKKPADWI